MSQLQKPGNSGGGSGIQTINGDTGSITGSTVTIYADNAANNSGGSVLFVNSGTVSTLNLTDASANTFLGLNSGSSTTPGSNNTGVGFNTLNAIAGGFAIENCAFGYSCLEALTTGDSNCALGSACLNGILTGNANVGIGFEVAQDLTTGDQNIIIGASSGINYTSSESYNILINNPGVVGESNVIRIGTQGSGGGQQDINFTAGITGVTAVGSPVAVSSTGQLSDLGFGTAAQVLTSNGAGVSPTWQAGGGGGSVTAFFAYLSASTTNIFGGGAGFVTIIYDSTTRNDGSAYNTSSGFFTAPHTGFYSFSICTAFNNIVTSTDIITSYTGSAITQILSDVGNGTIDTAFSNLILTDSFMIQMNAGDTIQIQGLCNESTKTVGLFGAVPMGGAGHVLTTFSGYFVGT